MGFKLWRRNGGMNALYICRWITVLCILFQDSKRTIKMLGTNTDMGCDAVRITDGAEEIQTS